MPFGCCGGSPKEIANKRHPSAADIGCNVFIPKYKIAGILRFVGTLVGDEKKIMCGVAYPNPIGKHDGKVKNFRYFRCLPKCGVLEPIGSVWMDDTFELGETYSNQDVVIEAGVSKRVGNGTFLKHTGRDWGPQGWYNKSMALHFVKPQTDTTVLQQWSFCPYSKDHVKGVQSSDLQLIKKLGEGQFGTAYYAKLVTTEQKAKAKALKRDDLGRIEVVVKQIHKDAPGGMEIEFAQEACVQNQFYHPNLVRMLFVSGGADLGGGPMKLIIEYCADGDLEKKLREGVLSWRDIIRTIADVANGCLYLATTGFVHCDLAARNVFLGGGVARIGDFGIYDYYNKIIIMKYSLPVKSIVVPVLLSWDTKYAC